MPPTFESASPPATGERVEIDDDGFKSPEAPIVPVVQGGDEEVSSTASRVLQATARATGRDIHWFPFEVETDSREPGESTGLTEALAALQHYRIGIVGPCVSAQHEAGRLGVELSEHLDLTALLTRHERLPWLPSPIRSGESLDVAVFRPAGAWPAGFEFARDEPGAAELGAVLTEAGKVDGHELVPPIGYRVTPRSEASTAELLDIAIDFAFEHDRDSLTIVPPAAGSGWSTGSFSAWATDYLSSAYPDGVVTEPAFRDQGDGRFPADEIVVFVRGAETVCAELLRSPERFDVLVAPGRAGRYVSAVASAAAGTPTDRTAVGLADELAVLIGRSVEAELSVAHDPIGFLLGGCSLFDLIGWRDASTLLKRAIGATLADGIQPSHVAERARRGRPVEPHEFAEAVIDRLTAPRATEPGVRTTPAERAAIKGTLAILYNFLFDDDLRPEDIELNQLLEADEEADIYLPEVGINFTYWRRWPVERRVEVVLHELAHVDETPEEPPHGDEFYERLASFAEAAIERREELEAGLAGPIEPNRLRRYLVESVHEDTIEPDTDSVRARKQWLGRRLAIDERSHY